MPYAVKEIYYTLQGEGVHTGRSAVFVRFAGCNLWDGIEAHRESAVCNFCDTDFVGLSGPRGGKYADPDSVTEVVLQTWAESRDATAYASTQPFVVCTGGEPLLQLDEQLISCLHDRGCFVAVETNGTLPVPGGLDWVCVSPKASAPLVVDKGDELKLVYPQPDVDPGIFGGLEFRHFSLQPMDGPDLDTNTRLAVGLLPSTSPVALEPANAQAVGNSVTLPKSWEQTGFKLGSD